MIWLTWRQFRAQAITAVAALAAFAILLAVTESHIASLYAASGLAGCHGDSCAGLASQFLIHLTSGQGFPLLPAGSNGYVILYFLSVFATHGITPLGYAAFGFALGVTAGLLIRRAIPAMAVTLTIFAVVQLVTSLWVRPHLLPSSRTIAAIEATQANVTATGPATIAFTATHVPGQPGAWITSSGAVNAAGQPVSGVPAACRSAIPHVPGPGGSPAQDNCLASHGIRVAVSYQPVSRYWPLQFAETGLFLALALALAWYCFWRLNRRLS